MVYTHLMFTGICCSAVDESNALAVVLTDRDDGGVDVYDIYDQPDTERLRSLFSPPPHRRYAGMATMINWSPDDGPSSPSWCLVTNGRAERARMAVRRIDEDVKWTLIDFAFAPWFAASTAGAIRAWLDGDFSAIIREGKDPRLLGQVRDMVVPPVHEDGMI